MEQSSFGKQGKPVPLREPVAIKEEYITDPWNINESQMHHTKQRKRSQTQKATDAVYTYIGALEKAKV